MIKSDGEWFIGKNLRILESYFVDALVALQIAGHWVTPPPPCDWVTQSNVGVSEIVLAEQPEPRAASGRSFAILTRIELEFTFGSMNCESKK